MELLLLVFLLLILVLPTFLMSRRQRAKMAEITKLQDSLRPGDEVVTTSGQHATVISVNEEIVILEIAPGVVTTWEKMAVVRVVSDNGEIELDDHNHPEVTDAPEMDAEEFDQSFRDNFPETRPESHPENHPEGHPGTRPDGDIDGPSQSHPENR